MSVLLQCAVYACGNTKLRRILENWRGVWLAAGLTTLACMAVSEMLVRLMYQGPDLWAALVITPFITFVTAFPVSFFIWLQLRRNIRLSIELQRLVNRDRLTDVATRDFFFARMRGNPQAYGISLMVDIDFFKTVNDTFGHMAGDVVIARVAEILRQNTRTNDIVCRFGGEEFVIFLHEEDSDGGFEVAERMRRTIADDVMNVEGHMLRVTVSIGGSLKERLNDVDIAIKQADHALYRAKSAGRNRTVFAQEPGQPNDAAA
jgi:diguanylate cyclase (GGDEF)-like protein